MYFMMSPLLLPLRGALSKSSKKCLEDTASNPKAHMALQVEVIESIDGDEDDYDLNHALDFIVNTPSRHRAML